MTPPGQATAPLDTPHEAEIPLKPAGGHNISSDAVDQAEISKIADELKAGLGRPVAEEKPHVGTQDPLAVPLKQPKPESEEGDTILIDKDGNLKAT